MSFSVTPLTIALLVLAVIMVAAPQFIRGTTSPHIQMMFAQHKFEELLAYLDTPLVRIGYPKWNRTFMKLNVYLVEGKTDDASLMLSELLSVHSSREQRKELILKAFDFYIGLERYEEAGALLPEITEITDEVTAKDRQATYDVLAKGNCGYVEEMEQDMEGASPMRKAHLALLLKTQYENLGNAEKATEYETLAKDALTQVVASAKSNGESA
jgi:hypothetical protein